MALPVRIRHGQSPSHPLAGLSRNNLGNVLSRFFGAGLFDEVDDDNLLAPISGFGVDIREDPDHIYVEADLPGFRREDIQVQLENDTLTIIAQRQEEVAEPAPRAQHDGETSAGVSGEQKTQGQQAAAGATSGQADAQSQSSQASQPGQQSPQPEQQSPREHKGEYLLRERRIQRYIRSFTLPPNVDESHVQAKLENGVLRITLDKREDSKPKRISVS